MAAKNTTNKRTVTKAQIERYTKAYNDAVRKYNAQSKKDYSKINQNTPAGRAAGERLRNLYNKVADRGQTLKNAVLQYQRENS